MNQAPPTASPWESTEALPRISPMRLLGAAAVTVLCAVAVPASFAFPNVLPLLLLVLLSAYTVVAVRHPGTVAFLLVAAFSLSFFVGYSVSAALLSLVVGMGSLSWLLTVTKRGYWFALLPAVAAGALLIATGEPILSLSALLFLPAAGLMSYATRNEKGRTSTILHAQLGLLLMLLLGAVLLLWKNTGEVSIQALTAALDGMRREALEGLVAFREEAIRLFEETLPNASDAELSELIASFRTSFSDTLLQNAVSLVFNLIPGIVAMLCGIVAYLSHLFLCGAYYAVGWRRVLTPAACLFTMSVVSAVIYFVAFLVLLLDASGSLFAVVMENICLILLPGFCVIGVAAFRARLHTAKGGARIFWILMLFLLVCCSGPAALFLLALWGANAVIMRATSDALRHRTQGPDPQ